LGVEKVATVSDHVRMAFGTEVRRIRKLRGLSIEDLAERAQLSANYIGGIEMNRRDPSLSTVNAIARGLGTTIAELFQETPESLSPTALQLGRAFEKIRPNLQDAIVSLVVAMGNGGGPPPRKVPPSRGAGRSGARKR
jgi:transcriptional regulator with XRE-family HTH domain